MRKYVVSAADALGVFHEVVEGVESGDLKIGDIILHDNSLGDSLSPREMTGGVIYGSYCWEVVGSSTDRGFHLEWGSDGNPDTCDLESDLPVYWRVIQKGKQAILMES